MRPECKLRPPLSLHSDPWQDATVTHINRMPMTAHYLPFTSENGALAQLKMDDARRFQLNTQNERRRSLDGVWKFKLVTLRSIFYQLP